MPVPRLEPRAKVAFRTAPGGSSSSPSAAQLPHPATASPSGPGPLPGGEGEEVAASGGATGSGAVEEAPSPRPSHARGEGVSERPLVAKPFVGKPLKKINPKFEKMVPPSAKVEKPNLRAPLSDDLQAELDAVLGSESLDDLIAAETGATGGESTGEQLEVESRHKGKVLRIFRDNVFVDLGGRNQGVLVLHSLAKEPEVGAEIEVRGDAYNAEDGLYELTAGRRERRCRRLVGHDRGNYGRSRVTGHNKGGLEAEVNKIRGFIPAGQISIYRVENFEEFVGQALGNAWSWRPNRGSQEFGAEPSGDAGARTGRGEGKIAGGTGSGPDARWDGAEHSRLRGVCRFGRRSMAWFT